MASSWNPILLVFLFFFSSIEATFFIQYLAGELSMNTRVREREFSTHTLFLSFLLLVSAQPSPIAFSHHFPFSQKKIIIKFVTLFYFSSPRIGKTNNPPFLKSNENSWEKSTKWWMENYCCRLWVERFFVEILLFFFRGFRWMAFYWICVWKKFCKKKIYYLNQRIWTENWTVFSKLYCSKWQIK